MISVMTGVVLSVVYRSFVFPSPIFPPSSVFLVFLGSPLSFSDPPWHCLVCLRCRLLSLGVCSISSIRSLIHRGIVSFPALFPSRFIEISHLSVVF